MRLFAFVILFGSIAGCSETAEHPQTEMANEPTYDTEIRWTSYGIPHVKANDWGSLGFGFAYATAQDGICLIARDVMLVNGEFSRYLGTNDGNRESDIFHRTMLNEETLSRFDGTETDREQAFSAGYVAGYNRYLRDHHDTLPSSCAGEPWVREINDGDLLRLTVGVGIRYGVGRYGSEIANAAPPGQPIAQRHTDFQREVGIGSNAVALGRAATRSGRGILFGNPHYPWRGSSRFHLIHTTIPGEVDVMGVSLLNTSRVAIGFNKDVAWSHTVSTALRSTLYQLVLNPENSMEYRYGEGYRPIEIESVEITARDSKGNLAVEQHTTYRSHYGPIVVSDELPWNTEFAYTVRDANINNDRAATTYHALNAATSIDDIEAAISQQGVAWTNTIAADRHGTAFYADISVTPNVDTALLERCSVTAPGIPASVVVLKGDDPNCEWQEDPRSAIAGTLPAEEMPRLRRDDYVTNSNDSYWLSNPHVPLEGYSPSIGTERTARSLRTRAGLTLVEAGLADGNKFTPEQVQEMLFSHRNFGAELLLDDVLQLCSGEITPVEHDGGPVDISPACQALTQWDRTQTIESRGAQVWTEFWRTANQIDNLYATPFSAENPVNTPRGVNLADPEVRAALRDSLANAQTTLDAAGIALDAPWGDVQFTERNGKRIPIPGGQGWAGMFSMIVANLQKDKGYTPIVHGNSYIQVISWDEAGDLDARGILTYSQSQDPESAHYADQTQLYSQGEWLRFPFAEAEIAADPNLTSLRLTQ